SKIDSMKKPKKPGSERAHEQSSSQYDLPQTGRKSSSSRSLKVVESQPLPAVFLSSPVRQPLVYRKRIRQIDAWAKNGDLVAVYADFRDEDESKKTELLGYGLLNKKAEIAVRMLRFGDQIPNESYWDKLLTQAIDLRKNVLRLDEFTDVYRLIHAESDGVSGLVVDLYGDVLSAEVFGLAMAQRAEAIVDKLLALCPAKEFIIRPAPHVLAQEGFQGETIRSQNLPRHKIVHEYGTQFKISFDDDVHKTGFFCDQRENRRQLAGYCRDKSVLDLCCYTGGFAVQAKKLGMAREVIGVDLDEAPLQIARQNANLNQCQIRFVAADIFPFMRDMLRNGRQFDVVVLDPPKLIRSRNEYEEGKRAHFDMNRLAMRLVKPGGILLTCTCAGLLGNSDFQELVLAAGRGVRGEGPAADPVQAAFREDVRLRILGRSGAGADHPVAANCLETEYLHAIWLQILAD
ncbi:MAG: class I SAM-dependent rRNA methyltransferase, partial [Pirellulaceae bacterium]